MFGKPSEQYPSDNQGLNSNLNSKLRLTFTDLTSLVLAL